MAPPESAVAHLDEATRRRLGAWYTPDDLVRLVVERTLDGPALIQASALGRPVTIVDPACGDGRFLAACASHLGSHGIESLVTGVDVDPVALSRVDAEGAELIEADACAHDWGERQFDVVVGNPPFRSPLDATASHGGALGSPAASDARLGPYADLAIDFLLLAGRLARPGGGRIGLILPQSVLSSRDAGRARAELDAIADHAWSWWSPRRQFDAEVVVCALGFVRRDEPRTHEHEHEHHHVQVPSSAVERGLDRRTAAIGAAGSPAAAGPEANPSWTHVITRHRGIPTVDVTATDGTLGDRAMIRANFRDEYYGLVGAVGDDVDGPPLVTSGVIDHGTCRWGDRAVRFARQRYLRPRVDLARLDDRMRRWATAMLRPKVLVANQTATIEAVADTEGCLLPSVPVVSVFAGSGPEAGDQAIELAAVLTSPVGSAWLWHHHAGTGLSARAVRVSPAALRLLPWPAGTLTDACAALRDGDVVDCGRSVARAYELAPAMIDELMRWWTPSISPDVARRSQPASTI